MKSVVVLAAVVVALCVSAAYAVKGDEGNFPGTKNCAVTGELPSKPRSLSFCHKFNDNACCAPATDSEANEYFDTLLDLGLSCRLRGDVRSHPMAKFYCMPCDPNQPAYIRNEPYVPFCEGECGTNQLYTFYQGSIFNDSGVNPDNFVPNAGNADARNGLKSAELVSTGRTLMPTTPRRAMILMCREWVEGEFGTPGNANYMSRFSRCGLIKSSPCLDVNGVIIPNRGRYTCGDDLVIPNTAFDSLEKFLNAEQLGPSGLSDNFGFAIVANRVCGASDLGALTPTQGGNRTNGGYDRFHPDCLRTVAQLRSNSVSAWSQIYNATAADNAEEYLNPVTDEQCFNSAASLVPYTGLLLVSLLVAFLAL